MKIDKTFASTGILLIAFYFMCLNLDKILSVINSFFVAMAPFIWAAVIILFANAISKVLCKKIKNEKAAAIISIIFLIVIIFIILSLIIPQIAISATQLINLLKTYDYSQIANWLSKTINLSPNFIKTLEESIGDVSKNAVNLIQQLMPSLMNATVNIANNIMNFLTGLIIAWYILSEKTKIKHFLKRIIKSSKYLKDHENIISLWKLSVEKINMFLFGKIVDSLIVGVICLIFMLVAKMDYAVLISVIIGVTNIIPFFGPFIGAIPSIFILLIANPAHALIFAIFILVLQQVDGNIIGPKILGDSVGISKLGIIFAIIVGGKMFGVVGMIIGVPVLAIIWEIISNKANIKA